MTTTSDTPVPVQQVEPPPWRLLPAALAVVLAVGASLLIGPRAPELGPETSGDPVLAADTRTATGDGAGFDTLGVASVAGPQRTAGLGGADADTSFELGSISKVLTGMLLADLTEDGVVALDDTLGEVLPNVRFADPDVAATTLEQLATHRSGLPRDLPGNLVARFTQALGSDPFGELSAQEVLDAAAATDAGPREPSYSNFGFAVLGHALAERTGMPYRDLLRERILSPLGMDDTVVVSPDETLPGAPGRTAGGTRVAPWRGWGYAPAGGAVWSTAADLGRLLDGVATGSAPGAWAAEPRADYTGSHRIGLGWLTTRYPTPAGDRTVTWHNGGTTGYHTWAGFDPQTGAGAAILSSTAREVDNTGLRLLGVDRDDPATPWLQVAVTLLLLVMSALAVPRALPVWGVRSGSARDRLRAPSAIVSAAVLLWLTHLLGAWGVVPPVLWTAALAAAAVGVVRIVAWWPRLPTAAGSSPRRRMWSTVGDLATSAAVVGLLFWATV